MGKFYVWMEIVCRGCADTVAGRHSSGGVPRQEMAKEAKAKGWAEHSDVGEWYCPACEKK